MIAHFLLLLATLQENPPAATTPAPAAATQAPAAASDPAALSFLRRVAKAQFASEERRLVDGFQLSVLLRERGEHPHDVRFQLDFDQRDGEHLGLRIDDPERGQVDKGFDGRDYWLREAGGEKQLLNGHEYAKDRESIDEALDLCGDLLLLLDVAQLEARSRRLRLKEGAHSTILEGELQRSQGSWTPFLLEVANDGALQALRLDLGVAPPVAEEGSDQAEQATPPAAPAADRLPFQRFRLLAWKDFAGRNIPQVIRIYDRADDEALPARILEIHDFRCQTHWVAAPDPR